MTIRDGVEPDVTVTEECGLCGQDVECMGNHLRKVCPEIHDT